MFLSCRCTSGSEHHVFRNDPVERLAQNLAVFDFELDGADMAAIHSLAMTGSRIVDPPGLAPLWDGN